MRNCGGCTLCCKLLPVHEGVLVDGQRQGGGLDKAAGERCPHQRTGKGCAVYDGPRMPMCCSMWNCRWLVNDDTAELTRPDRAHYVIDVLPDYITVVDDATGKETTIEVVQIWCDPGYPNAHRDPALRRYLERRAAEGKWALVRYDQNHAFTLVLSPEGEWYEHESKVDINRGDYSLLKVAAALQKETP